MKKSLRSKNIAVIRFCGGHITIKENGEVLINHICEDGRCKFSRMNFGKPGKNLVLELNGKEIHYSKEDDGAVAIVAIDERQQ